MSTGVIEQQVNAHAVKEGILARQKRIQELFSSGKSQTPLPEVGKFSKTHSPKRHGEVTYYRPSPQKASPQKTVHFADDDPTEDCTENLEDSASSWGIKQVESPSEAWGKYSYGLFEEEAPKAWGKYTHNHVEQEPEPVQEEEPEVKDEPKPVEESKQKQEPEPWGQYTHNMEKEKVKEPEQEPEPYKPTEEEIQNQLKNEMRKQVHSDLINTLQECLRIEEEDAMRRKEKYGHNVAILTEAPLEERVEKRKERLRQAKERIAREKAEEALREKENASKMTIIERREKAYQVYLHLGMPFKQKMKERVARDGSLSPEDVDLLPFLEGDFTVDVAALTRLQRQTELGIDH